MNSKDVQKVLDSKVSAIAKLKSKNKDADKTYVYKIKHFYSLPGSKSKGKKGIAHNEDGIVNRVIETKCVGIKALASQRLFSIANCTFSECTAVTIAGKAGAENIEKAGKEDNLKDLVNDFLSYEPKVKDDSSSLSADDAKKLIERMDRIEEENQLLKMKSNQGEENTEEAGSIADSQS